MNATRKIYSDQDEIELAWNELILEMKPHNPTRVPAAITVASAAPKAARRDEKKRLHHPALVTQNDFSTWEFFG